MRVSFYASVPDAKPILFWVYVSAVILLVALPLNGMSSGLNDITIVRIRGDYVAHFLLFMPWAFFLPQRPFWRKTWLVWGILFAAGSELLQLALPYRAWNINDLIGNSIGAVLGFVLIGLAWAVPRLRKKDNHK